MYKDQHGEKMHSMQNNNDPENLGIGLEKKFKNGV